MDILDILDILRVVRWVLWRLLVVVEVVVLRRVLGVWLRHLRLMVRLGVVWEWIARVEVVVVVYDFCLEFLEHEVSRDFLVLDVWWLVIVVGLVHWEHRLYRIKLINFIFIFSDFFENFLNLIFEFYYST